MKKYEYHQSDYTAVPYNATFGVIGMACVIREKLDKGTILQKYNRKIQGNFILKISL